MWKANCLSFGGRMTLIMSVIGSLDSYLMSMFLTLVMVLNTFEALREKNLWGTDLDERHMYLARWDIVIASRRVGVLRVRKLFSFNISKLFRWRWRSSTLQI